MQKKFLNLSTQNIKLTRPEEQISKENGLKVNRILLITKPFGRYEFLYKLNFFSIAFYRCLYISKDDGTQKVLFFTGNKHREIKHIRNTHRLFFCFSFNQIDCGHVATGARCGVTINKRFISIKLLFRWFLSFVPAKMIEINR